jgi:hypothetical protein
MTFAMRTKAVSAFINSRWHCPAEQVIFPSKSKADKLQKLSDI